MRAALLRTSHTLHLITTSELGTASHPHAEKLGSWVQRATEAAMSTPLLLLAFALAAVQCFVIPTAPRPSLPLQSRCPTPVAMADESALADKAPAAAETPKADVVEEKAAVQAETAAEPAPVAKAEPTSVAKVEPAPEVAAEASSTSIFTLQERKDGWDDVRGALKQAAKEREKPWQEVGARVPPVTPTSTTLEPSRARHGMFSDRVHHRRPPCLVVAFVNAQVKEQYISPASRWASVLADEIRPGGGTAADSDDMPQRAAAKQPEQRAVARNPVARKPEAAAEPMDKKAIVKSALMTFSNVLESAPKKGTSSARKASAPPKEASSAALVNTGILGGLLLGVPATTLALLFYLATQ